MLSGNGTLWEFGSHHLCVWCMHPLYYNPLWSMFYQHRQQLHIIYPPRQSKENHLIEEDILTNVHTHIFWLVAEESSITSCVFCIVACTLCVGILLHDTFLDHALLLFQFVSLSQLHVEVGLQLLQSILEASL